MRIFFYLSLVLLVSCSKCPTGVPPFFWGNIHDSNTEDASPLYTTKIFAHWVKVEPQEKDVQVFSTTFLIGESVKITVYTPPFATHDAQNQLAQWKKNYHIAQHMDVIQFGEFFGLHFEGESIDEKILAWCMHLNQSDYPDVVSLAGLSEKTQHAADVLIQAVGERQAIEKYRPEITEFVTHFKVAQESSRA